MAGWPAWTYISMAVSPLVLALFVWYEHSLPADRFPLVQLSLFRIRAFRIGVVIAAVFIAGIPAFFFTFSLMLQVGLGYSALHAGLTVIPWSIGTAVASAASARLAPKLGKYTIALGSALLVVGVFGIILTLHIRTEHVTSWDLIPAFLISGLGLGTVIAPLLNVILAGVPGRDAGSASGVLTTFQQLGGAIGVAVVGVVFFGLLSSRAATVAPTVTPQLRADLAALQLPPSAVDASVATFTRCFEARAKASDPAQPVPGCSPTTTSATSGQVSAAFQRAGRLALERDFITTVERTLFFNIGFWLLTGLFSLLLPRLRVQPPGGGGH